MVDIVKPEKPMTKKLTIYKPTGMLVVHELHKNGVKDIRLLNLGPSVMFDTGAMITYSPAMPFEYEELPAAIIA